VNVLYTSNGVQRGIYAYAGGQPARIEAWDDEELDGLSGKFFSESRRTHEQCLMRPRYDGYVAFQERGGIPLQEYLRGEVTRETAFGAIDLEYKRSLGRSGESPGRPEG